MSDPATYTTPLTGKQEALYNDAMRVMNANMSLPLLWRSAKLSAYYAVGLLHSGKEDEILLAGKIIKNVCSVQHTDQEEETYGTFPNDYTVIPATETGIVQPTIWATFDPNNALFVTLAGIVITALYNDRIGEAPRSALRRAMWMAVEGDARRVGGVKGDNLFPAYSNAWYMRCVCTAYVGSLFGDAGMIARAEGWAEEAVKAFDQFGTMSEFNSGTYTGVTIFALSLSQYLSPTSTLSKHAPRILTASWNQTAEMYNPTLKNLSGPWDRSYGFDMTRYFGCLGATMAGFMDREKSPLPLVLDSCSHHTDLAMIPMQMIVASYSERYISPEAHAKFNKLDKSRSFTTQAISPPFDRSPRTYTCWIEDGLSAGGIEFDQEYVGGASINPEQFTPGVIIWDAGADSSVGWISYYPTSPSCSIIAGEGKLNIRYPARLADTIPLGSRTIQLDISSFTWHQLGVDAFSTGQASLPGLNVSLSGTAVTHGTRSLTYGLGRHDLHHYCLTYTLPESVLTQGTELDLEIRWEKTQSPKSRFVLE